MEVRGITSSQSFGKLYCLPAVTQANQTPNFVRRLKRIKKIFSQNGFDRKRYVDVLLSYKDDHFYGIISSKKQGTPYHPDSIKHVAPTKQSIKNFKKWLNTWNYEYSPTGLRKLKEMKEKLLELMKKDN